jgi:hypothetical protein
MWVPHFFVLRELVELNKKLKANGRFLRGGAAFEVGSGGMRRVFVFRIK